MNKLPMPNLPANSSEQSSYDRLLSVKLNEYLGSIRVIVNTILQDYIAQSISSISTSSTLTNAARSILVTASATTQTMPAISTISAGSEWTIVLGVDGYVDIAKNAGDTWVHTTDSLLRLSVKGDSITLRAAQANKWVIV